MGRGEDDGLRALTGKVSLNTAAKILRKPKPPKINIRGKEGKELIRQRYVVVKSCMYLQKFKDHGVAVSIWEVMRNVGAKKPWNKSTDRELIVEAAKRLGMQVIQDKNTILFK